MSGDLVTIGLAYHLPSTFMHDIAGSRDPEIIRTFPKSEQTAAERSGVLRHAQHGLCYSGFGRLDPSRYASSLLVRRFEIGWESQDIETTRFIRAVMPCL